MLAWSVVFFFFFNDTATTEIYTLSLHDALPISAAGNRLLRPSRAEALARGVDPAERRLCRRPSAGLHRRSLRRRSEEHTSELQSRLHLVCRLLLEKKNNKANLDIYILHKMPTVR